MQTDPVKQKIIELCPDLLELKEGCQVLAGLGKPMLHTVYGYEADNGVFMAYLNKPFPKELQANSFYDCEFAIGTEGVEILGSPITLAVVLRAIKAAGTKYTFAVWVNENGTIKSIKHDTTAQWDLELDSYDQQSKECKQFIGSLLGV